MAKRAIIMLAVSTAILMGLVARRHQEAVREAELWSQATDRVK